jgi:hypothetical protein
MVGTYQDITCTNILIIKDESVMDTGKVVKAKELGVKIYTIDTFNKFMSK